MPPIAPHCRPISLQRLVVDLGYDHAVRCWLTGTLLLLFLCCSCQPAPLRPLYTVRLLDGAALSRDQVLTIALDTARQSYGVAVIDQQHAAILTEPVQVDSTSIVFLVAVSDVRGGHRIPTMHVTLGVTPLAYRNGQQLAPQSVPWNARQRARDLLVQIASNARRQHIELVYWDFYQDD